LKLIEAHFPQSFMENQKALEDRLLLLNEDRKLLEAEEAKMPTDTMGRTRAQRGHRQDIAQRLEAITREAAAIRLLLKKIRS
jgi:uncharacterized protein YjiK